MDSSLQHLSSSHSIDNTYNILVRKKLSHTTEKECKVLCFTTLINSGLLIIRKSIT